MAGTGLRRQIQGRFKVLSTLNSQPAPPPRQSQLCVRGFALGCSFCSSQRFLANHSPFTLTPFPFQMGAPVPQSPICTSPPASLSRDSDGVTSATALLGHLTARNPVPMTSSWYILFPSFLPHLGATPFGELSVNPQVLVAAPYIPTAETSPHGLLSQPLACLLSKVSQARV